MARQARKQQAEKAEPPIKEVQPSFDEVKATALDQIESLCARLLPDGRVKGNSYIARVPWRQDKKPSLSVLLKTGNWKDWGANEGGSIIDLVMKIDNCDAVTARDALSEMLGLKRIEAKARNFTSKRLKSCEGCAHLWQRFETADHCTRSTNPTTEEPLPIQSARAYFSDCGPDAKLYRPLSTEPQ